MLWKLVKGIAKNVIWVLGIVMSLTLTALGVLIASGMLQVFYITF